MDKIDDVNIRDEFDPVQAAIYWYVRFKQLEHGCDCNVVVKFATKADMARALNVKYQTLVQFLKTPERVKPVEVIFKEYGLTLSDID